MGKVLIDYWSAIELFCRIIERYEREAEIVPLNSNVKRERSDNKNSKEESGTDLSMFAKNETIDLYLEEAKTFYFYSAIQEAINKSIAENDLRYIKLQKKEFYEFALLIRNGEPVMLKDDEFKLFKYYVGNPKIRELSMANWEIRKKWTKQRLLENTKHYLYFYEEYDILNKQKEKVTIRGIVRAVLHLKMFSNADIISYSPKKDEELFYSGTFSTYNDSETYLHCTMKTKDDEKKDLHILLYIGTEKLNLAIGQFHNMGMYGGSIFSGTLLLDENESLKEDIFSVRFFKMDITDEWNLLPEHIRLFLSNSRNAISTPAGITDIEDFKIWLESDWNR